MVKKYHFCQLNNFIRNLNLLYLLLVFLLVPLTVDAHGLNVRYELPIPLSFYLITAGLIVILTVFLLRYFRSFSSIKQNHKLVEYRFLNPSYKYLNKIPFLFLVFLIIAGFVGSQGPLNNIINVFIWVWVWVGISYISIIFGNVWGSISPWTGVYSLLFVCFKKHIKLIRRHSGKEVEVLGLILLSIVLWIAIIFPGREIPYNLSLFLIFYSIVTFLGMMVYGRSRWNNSAEIFNLYFGMLGRIGILGRDKKKFVENFRAPLSGIHFGSGSIYSSVFIIIAVASISFDGVLETEAWDQFKAYIISVSFLRPILEKLVKYFGDISLVLNTMGFVFMSLIIGFLFSATCSRAKSHLEEKTSLPILIVAYSPALIPIAAAYHVAHYFSFLFIAGQIGIKLLSDPFGWGWNLFGTASMQVDISIINAKIGWSIILISVVLGHIASIIVSHRISFKISGNSLDAFRMHLPFSFFMVLYTVFSLWILAQPITH